MVEIPTVFPDRSGTLVHDAFFELQQQGDTPLLPLREGAVFRSMPPHTYRTGAECFRVHPLSRQDEPLVTCPSGRGCLDGIKGFGGPICECEVFDGPIETELVVGLTDEDFEDNDGPFLIVGRRVSAALDRSRLPGVELIPCQLEPAERHTGCRGTLPTGVSILQPRAAYCLRAWRLVGTANVCPHCGQGCIVCDVCGAMHTRCESCGREITCSADTPAEKRNGRVVYRHDWMTANCVIDGSRWGGEDLLCGWGLLIASRRIVDLLISLDAQGFSAEPIPVWVDNMTKDQLARLEEAKRPVKG
jgi:hypothetical protein